MALMCCAKKQQELPDFDCHSRNFLLGLGSSIETHSYCILSLEGTRRNFPLSMVGRVLSTAGEVLLNQQETQYSNVTIKNHAVFTSCCEFSSQDYIKGR